MHYDQYSDGVIVSQFHDDLFESVEDYIRKNRASRLVIEQGCEFRRIPCVSFITRFEVWCMEWEYIKPISLAISSMPLLTWLKVQFSSNVYTGGGNDISYAIADHPSIKSISIPNPDRYGINMVMRENKRITKYRLGIYRDNDFKISDVLVGLTHVKTLDYISTRPTFRRGDLVKFVRGNPGIRELSVCVATTAEAIEAFQHLRNIKYASISLLYCDDTKRLKSAIMSVLMRCNPKYFTVTIEYPVISIRDVWPNHYWFNQRKLPKWNFSRSASIHDTRVHTTCC